jgi:RNA polymerase sigma-70 factor, ECF subfamily
MRETDIGEPLPGWDVRAAICEIGREQLKEHTDEALVFLLVNAIDRRTADELFNEIFRRYHFRVVAWCCRMTRDRERALDLAQEVFLRAFQRMRTYHGDSRFSTWLFTIARNHCLNFLKKQAREPSQFGDRLPLELPGSDGMETHTAMERHQSLQEMWRLINATLTPIEARVVALHFGHGLQLAIITRQLRLSNPCGAKAYIVSARRKLNAVLGGGRPKSQDSAGLERARKQPGQEAARSRAAAG